MKSIVMYTHLKIQYYSHTNDIPPLPNNMHKHVQLPYNPIHLTNLNAEHFLPQHL